MDMARYAIIVIDMLEEFVRGRLKAEEAENIVPYIKRLVDFAHSYGIPVIHTVDRHYPDIDAEFRLWGPHAVIGSKEARIIDELYPTEKDYVVYKRRYDAFVYTDLDLLLKELGVSTLILSGIHTHICVQNTALGAFYRGYKVIVPVECVAAATREWHERGLEYMKSFVGAELIGLEDLLGRLKHELSSQALSV